MQRQWQRLGAREGENASLELVDYVTKNIRVTSAAIAVDSRYGYNFKAAMTSSMPLIRVQLSAQRTRSDYFTFHRIRVNRKRAKRVYPASVCHHRSDSAKRNCLLASVCLCGLWMGVGERHIKLIVKGENFSYSAQRQIQTYLHHNRIECILIESLIRRECVRVQNPVSIISSSSVP